MLETIDFKLNSPGDFSYIYRKCTSESSSMCMILLRTLCNCVIPILPIDTFNSLSPAKPENSTTQKP